ncbi:hypothetical protein DSO57_1015666 [Entomophthora muscae]|uniref:Uncharacterized protein n=1 Tax=Entomophthora muscae TaxID=34485 RepID=A0ACC2UEY3_9FUNG|nr:hypothetical protein DSO57_1015666 [Entomophthora muscae]
MGFLPLGGQLIVQGILGPDTEPVEASNDIVAEPCHDWLRELNWNVSHSHREGYRLISDGHPTGVGHTYCLEATGYLV